MSLTFRPSRREGRLLLHFDEPTPDPPPPLQPRVPMAYRKDSWDFVDPQISSPLFSGRIPPEIRSLIFDFALTESVGPAWDRHVQHDFYSRPDHDKLDDEPMLAPAAEDDQDDETEDETDYESGSEYSLEPYNNVEDGPAPAVQMPPASFLCLGQSPSSGWDWLRPGYVGQRKLQGTALLRTCRRIYIETNELPSQAVNKTFYSSKRPYFCPDDPRMYISRLPPEAARQIRHLHVFSDTVWLEREFYNMITNMYDLSGADTIRGLQLPHPMTTPFLTLQRPPRLSANPSIFSRRPWRVSEHLTSLRIVIRRTDWLGWEINMPLAISPFRSVPRHTSAHQMMHQEMLQALDNLDPLQRHPSPSRIEQWSCWGLLFLQMVSLKTLTIDFETSEDKRDEMEAIVRWAHQHWRFPILQRLSGDSSDPLSRTQLLAHARDRPVDLTPWSSNLRVLTAEDDDAKRSSWRGMPYHFADLCPSCSVKWSNGDSTAGCERCDKMGSLKVEGKGPQLLVWTVTWTPKSCQDGSNPSAAALGVTGVRAEADVGEGSRNHPRPSNAAGTGQGGGRPGNPNTESHVLTMLPRDAQYRLRRQREVEEILISEVCF